MRKARVALHGIPAGLLTEEDKGPGYQFAYFADYSGLPVSLTMPVKKGPFFYNSFPPFFDGLLPEGVMLDSLLRQLKIDEKDYFSQLMAVGADLVGAVTVEAIDE
jgi:serine/threonine-protein kinase HipA